MSSALYVGAAGLQAQQRALDIVANNIANVNTPAFKRSNVSFSQVVIDRASSGVAPLDGNIGVDQLSGVQMTATPMMSEQGQLERTEQALDLAIEGNGFIELMGPAGQTLLWRGGRLRILEDGTLASSDGMPLRAAISIPNDALAINIARDGTVSTQVSDGSEAIELGQITLVRVPEDSAMELLDGGLYRLSDGATPTDGVPGEEAFGSLVQGAVERSNVSFNDEIVRMLLVQRAYAANAQVVQAADQLLGIANNLRRA